jgi:hypothetical protein
VASGFETAHSKAMRRFASNIRLARKTDAERPFIFARIPRFGRGAVGYILKTDGIILYYDCFNSPAAILWRIFYGKIMKIKKIFAALLTVLFLAPVTVRINYSFAEETEESGSGGGNVSDDNGGGEDSGENNDNSQDENSDGGGQDENTDSGGNDENSQSESADNNGEGEETGNSDNDGKDGNDKSTEDKKSPKNDKSKSSEKGKKETKEKSKAPKKEYSTKEKAVMAGSMAAAGIGGMQLAQGLSEMKADKEAAADMENHLKTITCGIGGAKNVKYAESGTAPEQTRQFVDERLKYIALAQKIKHAKEMLGMAPGIESEIIVDTANLYQGRGTDKDGIAHHFDTATERLESKSGQKRAIIGGVAAAAGIVGGIVGNAIINKPKDGASGGGDGGGSGCECECGKNKVEYIEDCPISFVPTGGNTVCRNTCAGDRKDGGGRMTPLCAARSGEMPKNCVPQKQRGIAGIPGLSGVIAAGRFGKELTKDEIELGKKYLLESKENRDELRNFAGDRENHGVMQNYIQKNYHLSSKSGIWEEDDILKLSDGQLVERLKRI